MFASRKKVLYQALLTVTLSLCFSTLALAHRVNVFCWVEGSKINCEAKFTPGGPVKDGKISVYSQQTGELLTITSTDSDGKAVFEIPEKAKKNKWDLKVVCDAEMGHKNFWVVKAGEFLPMQAGVSSAKEDEPPSISQRELEQILSRTLRKELGPVKRDLAELKEKPITIQDVLGGIGYIFGLAGVALYFLSRREK